MITTEQAIKLLEEGKCRLEGEENYMTEGELIIKLEALQRYEKMNTSAAKEEMSREFFLHANSINRINYPLREKMYDSTNPLLRPLYMYIDHLQREILILNARIDKLEKEKTP